MAKSKPHKSAKIESSADGRSGKPLGARRKARPLSHSSEVARDESQGEAKRRVGPPPAIGRKLKQFRLRENLTLQDVEAITGISKSMLSQIERGVVNPTFARVWHLTQSLGIGVGDLLDEIYSSLDDTHMIEHLKVHSTPVMTSADGLCITRILSPIHRSLPFEWYEMILKPGGCLRANAHGTGAWEHQTVICGTVVVEIGSQEVVLKAGETVRYSAEQPHGARNDGNEEARLFLVVISRKDLVSLGYE